jgi:pantothenate kinase type III
MGGARATEDGVTNPVTLPEARANRSQSLPQDRTENAGPAGCLRCAFAQQHFMCARQQERLVSPDACVASGAHEASDRSNVRHAINVLRAIREL